MRIRPNNTIPGSRATQLRNAGLSFRKIGEQIAKEQGRVNRYQPESCRRAAREYKQGVRE